MLVVWFLERLCSVASPELDLELLKPMQNDHRLLVRISSFFSETQIRSTEVALAEDHLFPPAVGRSE